MNEFSRDRPALSQPARAGGRALLLWPATQQNPLHLRETLQEEYARISVSAGLNALRHAGVGPR
jgi:hypothetical protein